ncbi:MAG: protein BatD [Cryobacterium sp.]|nr:protein BatD [Oligoflexia bacterium]
MKPFFQFALPCLISFSSVTAAFAVEFHAEVDRTEIAQDESLSLKLVVEADGTVPVETPEFTALNFEEIQNYQGSSVQSYYDSDNGKFGAKFTRSFTYVLRPKTTGRFSINGIKIRVDGKSFTAAPITVSVSGGGGGTPPPQGYGGAGSGLRGAAKKGRGTVLFLRTEVDKTKVYRGQQVVTNYYLYSRATNFNATADRYPNLNGFLKEELDIPILSGRLKAENVVLDGTAYRRVLVASFAAYPLKEGKLTIDPMEVKATYIAERENRGANSDDPFADDDLFQNFFRGGAPQTENLRSESITVDVSPLPPVPKGLNYTGGVGDFDVISAVDRTEVKAGEAVTLTLKIEGKGNLSNIDTPKISLPDGMELYEAKSQTKGKAGIGEKVFEYLLIPRKEGDFTLPAVELGFFDPNAGEYTRKSTSPISIHVLPGMQGSDPVGTPPVGTRSEVSSPEKSALKIFGLFNGTSEGRKDARLRMTPAQKGFLLAGIGLLIILGLLVQFRHPLRRRFATLGSLTRQKKARERAWSKIRRQAEDSQRLPFQEVIQVFDFLERQLEEALFRRFGIAPRGFTRTELKEALVDRALIPETLWQRIALLLEFTETLRYASKAGVLSEDRSRNELKNWVAECEQILAALREI